MHRGLSLHLDLVRVSAALIVVLTHLAYESISGGQLAWWRKPGNDAVMVFFVLSGVVIAHVAATREHDPREYALSRMARLWSVAVPALAVTILCDELGKALNPAEYAGAWWYHPDWPLARIAAALTFTNQIWLLKVVPFSNGPYWSLGYEFWYYALFGAVFYFRGRVRWLLAGACCLIMGPKVLLLAPIWWLGVWTYRHIRERPVGERAGLALFFASIAAYALFRGAGGPDWLLDRTHEALGGRATVKLYLNQSNEFLASYIIAPMVAAHFLGAAAIAPRILAALRPAERAIRWIAQYTFTIYLVHYPVLRLLSTAVPYDKRSPVDVALIYLATVAVCVGVGMLIEPRKGDLRRALDRALTALQGARPAAVAR